MILKSLRPSSHFSMTSKWLLPLVYYFNNRIQEALKDVRIIGTALGDVKHGVPQSKFLFICSSSGAYDYFTMEFSDPENTQFNSAVKELEAYYKHMEIYSFYHFNEIIKVIAFDLEDLVPNIASSCILNSQYSKLAEAPFQPDILKKIYPPDVVNIIYKTPEALNKYTEYLAARIGCLIEDVDLTYSEYEQTFQIKNEMLYCKLDVSEVNIDDLTKLNVDSLKKDIKIVLENRFDINEKVILYGISIESIVLEKLLKQLEQAEV